MMVTLSSVFWGQTIEAYGRCKPSSATRNTLKLGQLIIFELAISEKILLCMDDAHACSFYLAKSTDEFSSFSVQ